MLFHGILPMVQGGLARIIHHIVNSLGWMVCTRMCFLTNEAVQVMPVLVKLDKAVIALLACPLCKGVVSISGEWVRCDICGSCFPKISPCAGAETFDFRLRWPAGWEPPGWRTWSEIQRKYEEWSLDEAERADLMYFLEELDSVVRSMRCSSW